MYAQMLLLGFALLLGALAALWASHVEDLRLLHQGVRHNDSGKGESGHSAHMAALEQEVAASGAYVDAVLKGRGVPKQERSDFVQRVLMAALEAIQSGRYEPRPGVSVKAYLAGIARNIVGLARRKHGREELYDPCDQDWECLTPLPDIVMDRSEVWKEVTEDLQHETFGNVLVAYYLEETPMADVARLLDIPEKTAYSRKALALARLRVAARRRGRP